jgi:hypothetical protein
VGQPVKSGYVWGWLSGRRVQARQGRPAPDMMRSKSETHGGVPVCRKMSYRKLMAMVADDKVAVNAWSDGTDGEPTLADVTFYGRNLSEKRERVEVTSIPANL